MRNAGATGPLGIMNTERKIVQHVVNRDWTPHVTAHSHRAQRAFVAQRNLLANVAELDTEMWFRALGAEVHQLPCVIFFDFIVAFPSADHCFLMDSLLDAGLRPAHFNSSRACATPRPCGWRGGTGSGCFQS